MKMLYDTGADICCMSEQMFKRIKAKTSITSEGPKKQFKAAGGQKLQVMGKYSVPMTIGKKEIRHPFFVIKDLSEEAIIGIDFIEEHGLHYNPSKRSFKWKHDPYQSWETGTLKVQSVQVIPPFTVMHIKTKVITEDGTRPHQEATALAQITAENRPVIQGGPDLVKVNECGIASIMIQNCSPVEVTLERDEVVGFVEQIEETDIQQIHPDRVKAVKETASKLTEAKRKFIMEKMNLDVPDTYRQKFIDLLLRHHDVFSENKYDLGRAKHFMHEIALRTEEPVYIKQFKIPDAHREEVEKHVGEWLKLGVIQPTRSKFNSPIFVVAKKNGGLRIVQDFRGLNENTMVDKYSMKDVGECIGEIGRSNSTIFSTLDLTAGFWQMLLHPKCRPYTAFTLPGRGQFQWVTSPMGLLGCPASFQRLMESVMKDIDNVIVYIDDLLAHTSTYEEHLLVLDAIFTNLSIHGLKVNLEKCHFGCKKVAYLGFHLTEEGIKPGSDKLKTVAAANPPTNVHEIRQFLGLCNFFRTHVRNFAQISAPLTALTRKDSAWKSGPLPEDARIAFRELQSYLCSEPVVDYPRRNRPYALITDAALGDDKSPGGLGAILTQVDEQGEYRVISYASRKLQTHEKNYTPFLLEMQAAIWGMDHYSTYLRGRHFTLFTDHKPLEKLGKVHTRTLNRLQEAMNHFDFEIVYKKGSEMPADFLSRHAVSAISWESTHLKEEQEKDVFIKALKDFLLNRTLPSDPRHQQLIRHFSFNCFIEDDLVWVRIKRYQSPSRVVLFLPQTMIHSAISDAHGQHLTGHDGSFKTKERLLQCYYWPGMDKDIIDHIQRCHKCQVRKNDHRPPPALLTPLPQPTEINMRIHADLHGPLKTSGNYKKYILVITDAFTKYVELVAIDNKEAVTVTEAIFRRWICRYGVPLEIITDQGKEFCNKLSDELYKLLQTKHLTTSSRHPACNAQAEVANKTIAKYLNSFVDDTTLDWEIYLAPLMFCYNTSFHRSIKNTPYFLTYGQEPRLPNLPTPDLRRKFYGESSSAELYQTMMFARDTARRYNEEASDNYKSYYDKKAAPHNYKVHQLVLLDEHSFLGLNTKLAPKWSGPHRITKVKNETNVELLLKNNKRIIVHVNRIKPYIAPIPDSQNIQNAETKEKLSNESFFQNARSAGSQLEENEDEREEEEDDRPPRAYMRLRGQSPSPERARAPQEAQIQHDTPIAPPAHVPTAEPVKRPRGRPRKTPLPTVAQPVVIKEEPPEYPPFEEGETIEIEILRAVSPSPPQKGGGIVNDCLTHDYQQNCLAQQDDEEEGWILVTRRHKGQREKDRQKPRTLYTKAQTRSYRLTGDVYNFTPYPNYQSHDHSDPYHEDLPENLDPEEEDPPDQPPIGAVGPPIPPIPPDLPPAPQGARPRNRTNTPRRGLPTPKRGQSGKPFFPIPKHTPFRAKASSGPTSFADLFRAYQTRPTTQGNPPRPASPTPAVRDNRTYRRLGTFSSDSSSDNQGSTGNRTLSNSDPDLFRIRQRGQVPGTEDRLLPSRKSSPTDSPVLSRGGDLFRFGSFNDRSVELQGQSSQLQQVRRQLGSSDPGTPGRGLGEPIRSRPILRPPVLQRDPILAGFGSRGQPPIRPEQPGVRPTALPVRPLRPSGSSTQTPRTLSRRRPKSLSTHRVPAAGQLPGITGAGANLGAANLPRRQPNFFDLFDQLSFGPAPPRPHTRSETARTGRRPITPPKTPPKFKKDKKE